MSISQVSYQENETIPNLFLKGFESPVLLSHRKFAAGHRDIAVHNYQSQRAVNSCTMQVQIGWSMLNVDWTLT